MRKALGPALKELRTSKKLSQEALGARLGVNRLTVGRWERGEHFPPDAIIQELPSALEITVERFEEVFGSQLAVALREREEPPPDERGAEEDFPPVVSFPSEIAGGHSLGGRWISVYIPPESLENLRR